MVVVVVCLPRPMEGMSSVVISVRVPESVARAHISDEDCVWYVYDVLYALLYVCVICFVVR